MEILLLKSAKNGEREREGGGANERWLLPLLHYKLFLSAIEMANISICPSLSGRENPGSHKFREQTFLNCGPTEELFIKWVETQSGQFISPTPKRERERRSSRLRINSLVDLKVLSVSLFFSLIVEDEFVVYYVGTVKPSHSQLQQSKFLKNTVVSVNISQL